MCGFPSAARSDDDDELEPIDKYGEVPELDDYKFGIVINNDVYTIYRSAKIGSNGLREINNALQRRGLPRTSEIFSVYEAGFSLPSTQKSYSGRNCNPTSRCYPAN
jgi:hypothetical protein